MACQLHAEAQETNGTAAEAQGRVPPLPIAVYHSAQAPLGTNDPARETRARLVPGRAGMLPWLADAVLAAHAFGLDILDGVYNDIADLEGFSRS